MLAAILACLVLVLVLGVAPARANTLALGSVSVQDNANVLSSTDKQNIQSAAQSLNYPVTILTSSSYQAKDAFYTAVHNLAGNGGVAMGVDPVHKWSRISASTNTGLTAADVDRANAAANQQFGGGQWGAGFVAAINALSSAPSSGSGAGSVNPGGGSSGTGTGTGAAPAGGILPSFGGSGLVGLLICCIPIILLIGLAIFLRNRMSGRGAANRGYYGPGQGNYPPGNYPPGTYPQGYNQGGGLGGNLGSGILGALGGWFLGSQMGRNQNQGQQGTPGVPPGTDFGGQSQGQYGGGVIDSSSSGSGADFGNNQDAGGGGGVSFGGGGQDFGGGGGGTVDSGGSSGGGSDF